jgi:uncharacterized repeat protein (TIGR03803 family)
MRRHKLSSKLTAMMFAVAVFLTATLASAQREITLHSFGNATDGTGPNGSLISDAVGNLYGTTLNGGAYEGHAVYTGTAFKLSPAKGGGWTETILHSFGYASDGEAPSAGLISDASGNLYGTTVQGGGTEGCTGSTPGCGIIFQLRPPATKGGHWTEAVLYRFDNGNDGANPQGVLTLDSSGNLYGTTNTLGGSLLSGSVFELSPRTSGDWRISVLHIFNSNGSDGVHPTAGLTFDSSGNLYGTTCYGGTYGGGTVFELSPKTGGGWTEKILYDFNSSGNDAACPNGGVIFDSSGNLYGTANGGIGNYGTVFQLSPSGVAWTEKVLYRFNGGSTDGYYPSGGVVFDTAGNLYGATSYGGTYSRGTIFELTPTGGGWSENIVHNFGSVADGAYPSSGNFLIDADGNLFGATGQGGAYDGLFGSGTVFEFTPGS